MTRAARANPTRGWLALLGLSSGLSAFGMASVLPALPLLGEALDQDYGTLQFVVSAYLLGLGLAQPVQGMLCDRYGRRPVMLLGFAAFGLASVAAAFAPSLPLLVAARFLQALGVSVGTVASRAMVRDTHEPERAAIALAFITAIMGIAPILGPLAGGLASGLWGWRSLFALHAVMAFVLVLWMHASLIETRPEATRAMNWADLRSGARALARDRPFVGYTMAYGFSNGGTFAFVTVGADLFGRLFGMTPQGFGFIWSGLALAYAAGAALAARLARRRGSARSLRAGLVLGAASALVLLGVALYARPAPWMYVVPLVSMTLASGLVAPLALAGAVSERPTLAGLASGVSSSAAMLTSMVFAALSGTLYHGSALEPVALVAAGALLGLGAVRLTERRETT